MLTNPLIFNKPLNVWLGFVLVILILLQISIGKGWIKLPFNTWHKNLLPWAIVIVMLIHGWYGFQIYFLK